MATDSSASRGRYREVQRRSVPATCPVIELHADDAGELARAVVTIFGTETTDLTPLDAMRAVHVALVDEAVNAEYVYPALILHSGLLAASDAAAGGLSFSPRRSAFRRGRNVASIGPECPIDQAVSDFAQYFVTLRLGELDPNLTTDAPPVPEVRMRAIPPEESPLLSRLDGDALQRLFRGKEPRVRHAIVQSLKRSERGTARRGHGHDAPLVAMRILRRH